MIAPEAIRRFTERQRQLVHDTYDQAWQRGVGSYEPDEDPDEPTPVENHAGEEATLSGVALLRARSQRAYRPPAAPSPERRQQALVGALNSTQKMAGQLAALSPTPEQMAQAQREADTLQINASLVALSALAIAVSAWAEANAYRLDAGVSVAWAGEQAGYAESADADGQLLSWVDEGDDRVCGDCEALDAMGPMPLEDFPTFPGDGATECDVGCRCSMEASPSDEPALLGEQEQPPGEVDQAALDKIANQAQEHLDQAVPNFALV